MSGFVILGWTELSLATSEKQATQARNVRNRTCRSDVPLADFLSIPVLVCGFVGLTIHSGEPRALSSCGSSQ